MSNIIYGGSRDSIVTNARGLATPGYIIEITFPEFDEIHDIKVETMDPDVVQAEAEKLYAQRAAIAALNEPVEE